MYLPHKTLCWLCLFVVLSFNVSIQNHICVNLFIILTDMPWTLIKIWEGISFCVIQLWAQCKKDWWTFIQICQYYTMALTYGNMYCYTRMQNKMQSSLLCRSQMQEKESMDSSWLNTTYYCSLIFYIILSHMNCQSLILCLIVYNWWYSRVCVVC